MHRRSYTTVPTQKIDDVASARQCRRPTTEMMAQVQCRPSLVITNPTACHGIRSLLSYNPSLHNGGHNHAVFLHWRSRFLSTRSIADAGADIRGHRPSTNTSLPIPWQPPSFHTTSSTRHHSWARDMIYGTGHTDPQLQHRKWGHNHGGHLLIQDSETQLSSMTPASED